MRALVEVCRLLQPSSPRCLPPFQPALLALVVVVAVVAVVAPAGAATDPGPPSVCDAAGGGAPPADGQAAPVPSDETLEACGAVIGEVTFRVENIFDPSKPGENTRLFRLANRLHRTTRASVIEHQLVFRPGDRYSRRELDESERILRRDRYIYDASIRPVRYAGNRVDVEVVTRDVWTLKVGASLGRSGGTNSTRFQVQDTNVLGSGKSLTAERTSTVDRTASLFRYNDHNVVGSRVELELLYSDNSDGRLQSLSLERPFFSLDSRWAAGLTAADDDRVDSLWELGHITAQLQHRQRRFDLHGGLSRGFVAGRTRRWTAGFSYQRDEFSAVSSPHQPAALPPQRTLAYPWVAFDSVQDQFQKTRDLDQMSRTEDLYLGRRLHLLLGYSSPLWGGDRSALVLDGEAARGFKLTSAQTLLFALAGSGRWRSGAENLRVGGSARYYWRDFDEQLFFATLEADVARNLDPESQLLLGGDTGLRGYPLRYQSGDERLLLTLEQRVFTRWYPFKLVHVGGAVFFDAGRTWIDDRQGAANLGLLKDVGVGLRLSSSRSGLGSIIHFDLAFPLDGGRDISRTQFLVTTKATF
jgi:outer membrane protein assembly factor BamA